MVYIINTDDEPGGGSVQPSFDISENYTGDSSAVDNTKGGNPAPSVLPDTPITDILAVGGVTPADTVTIGAVTPPISTETMTSTAVGGIGQSVLSDVAPPGFTYVDGILVNDPTGTVASTGTAATAASTPTYWWLLLIVFIVGGVFFKLFSKKSGSKQAQRRY